MKPHTIKNVFQNSGMWLVSTKAGIQKMRKDTKSYRKRKNKQQSEPTLSLLLKNLISQSEEALNKCIEKDPTTWSSFSRQRHKESLKTAKVQLYYAHLVDSERQIMCIRLTEDQNRQLN